MTSNKNRFSLEIEKLKEISPDISYVELIAEYCEINNIEIEQVPRLLTVNIIQKISTESKKLHLVNIIDEHIPISDDFI